MKNVIMAEIASVTVVSSVGISSFYLQLKPTPAGSYKYTKFALLFQAYGLTVRLCAPGLKMKGPFANSIGFMLEHPGPPVSEIIKGSVVTFDCD